MRNFGASDRMTKIMETFGMKEGEELEHPWRNKSVEPRKSASNSATTYGAAHLNSTMS